MQKLQKAWAGGLVKTLGGTGINATRNLGSISTRPETNGVCGEMAEKIAHAMRHCQISVNTRKEARDEWSRERHSKGHRCCKRNI